MTKQNELKPCPFCGGAAVLIYCGNEIFTVRCFTPCATYCHTPKMAEEAAIKAWNTRAQPPSSEAFESMPDGADIHDLGDWAFEHRNEIRKALGGGEGV